MEVLLSIIAFAGVYSILLVVRSLASRPDVKAKPIIGEAFPEIEVLEVPQAVSEPPAVRAETARSLETKKKMLSQKSLSATPLQENATHKTGSGRLASLGNRSEAKKAVIYSEIFNRKY